jgi:hypothetical protein
MPLFLSKRATVEAPDPAAAEVSSPDRAGPPLPFTSRITSQKGGKMDSYEEYEEKLNRMRKENERILSDFEAWLSEKNLSRKTINNHRLNVDFYINEFLLYEDTIDAASGWSEIGMFFGYWFIKKAMWASKTSMKEMAASLKKFYQFMLENGGISKESFDDLKQTIKEDMPEWLATLERYDDPDIEDPGEVWGL